VRVLHAAQSPEARSCRRAARLCARRELTVRVGRFLGACVLGGALVASACSAPAPGDPCRDIGEGRCADPEHALTCRNYALHLDACRGPGGCAAKGPNHVSCDQDEAREGDACGDRGAVVCAVGRHATEKCDGVSFAQAALCRGPGGCTYERGDVTCDDTVAMVGDPCGAVPPKVPRACSPDYRERLVCSAGRFEVETRCTGPNGCATSDGTVSCDTTIANVVDACPSPMRGQHAARACTASRDAELLCVGGVFQISSRCPGLHRCEPQDDGPRCNGALFDAGMPCDGYGERCASDGRTALYCTDGRRGHWAKLATCRGPGGCALTNEAGRVRCDQTIASPGDACVEQNGGYACNPEGNLLLSCDASSRTMQEVVPRRDTCQRDERQMVRQRGCPHECRVTGKTHVCR
jgi:hypothetical protein